MAPNMSNVPSHNPYVVRLGGSSPTTSACRQPLSPGQSPCLANFPCGVLLRSGYTTTPPILGGMSALCRPIGAQCLAPNLHLISETTFRNGGIKDRLRWTLIKVALTKDTRKEKTSRRQAYHPLACAK